MFYRNYSVSLVKGYEARRIIPNQSILCLAGEHVTVTILLKLSPATEDLDLAIAMCP